MSDNDFLQTKNNAKSTSTELDNTDDPVTFDVDGGHGARFPDTADGPFRVTVWSTAYADPADDTDMEILEVTSRSTDALTATRAGEGTSKVAHSGTVNVALLNTSGLREVLVDTLKTGWNPAGETWTFGVIDAPTFTFTIAAFDATSKYSVGMRVKLTNASVKYFIITAVTFDDPGSTITVYGGTDYALVDAVITSPFYSTQKAPFGFPLDPIKWSVIVVDNTSTSQADPVQNTWYNVDSLSIDIPIGSWLVSYFVILYCYVITTAERLAAFSTLSTANDSEVDKNWTNHFYTRITADSQDKYCNWASTRENYMILATKDTFYLNEKHDLATPVKSLGIFGSTSSTVLRAVCAYL